MAEDEKYSEENLIIYVKQLKAKEEAINQREARLKQMEESSSGYKAEQRVKTLEEELGKTQAELAERNMIIENVRNTVGLRDVLVLEDQLKAKEAELNGREIELAKHEALSSADYRKLAEIEFKEERARTGNVKLDDLLYGGIPFGKNIILMGPPFIGKETLANQFLLEGLIKGIPAVVITTDSSPRDIMDELKLIAPNADEYLRNRTLVFIDAYSKTLGLDQPDNPAIKYVDGPTDYMYIGKNLSDIADDFKDRSPHFRMVVRSVSSMVTLSDPAKMYRSLQHMTGKTKHYKNVSLYLIDKGMHTETEIQTIGHLMDGAIEVKTDGTKTYLHVDDICDVQSRNWIKYNYSKRGLHIESFNLDHIK
jgi:KaiC/GvpD/RAD55 family RecA-like ATPase